MLSKRNMGHGRLQPPRRPRGARVYYRFPVLRMDVGLRARAALRQPCSCCAAVVCQRQPRVHDTRTTLPPHVRALTGTAEPPQRVFPPPMKSAAHPRAVFSELKRSLRFKGTVRTILFASLPPCSAQEKSVGSAWPLRTVRQTPGAAKDSRGGKGGGFNSHRGLGTEMFAVMAQEGSPR